MILTLVFVGLVVVLVIVTVLRMPATTSATVEIRFDATIGAVWQVYTDFESQPNWRSDVASVDMAEDNRSWTETLKTSRMTIRFQILEEIPPNRLTLKTGADGIFKGQYVAEFREEEGKTIGTFTEEATTLGIVPKLMRRLFVNQKKLIEEYAAEAKAEINRRNSSADHR